MACSTRVAGAADHRLTLAVDIGDHHVAVDRLEDSFDLCSGANTAAILPLSAIEPPASFRGRGR